MSPRTCYSIVTVSLVTLLAAITATANIINLEAKLTVIDSLINRAYKRFGIPGMAVGIVANGDTVFHRGYGLRDVNDNGSNVTSRTLFGIGSCSKSFTTYALDRLVNEDGVMSWDDLVLSRIPEFRLQDVSTKDRIKVKDLVTHVSGLPGHDLAAYHSHFPRKELLVRIAHLEPNFDLREEFQYNNIMYSIAGVVLERMTGETWEEAIRNRVFSPLNMTRSFASIRTLRNQSQPINDIASPHQLNGSLATSIAWLDLTHVAPSGGIISSVDDIWSSGYRRN